MRSHKGPSQRLLLVVKVNEKVSTGEALHIISNHANDSSVVNAQGLFLLWTPIFLAVNHHNTEVSLALAKAPAINLKAIDYFGRDVLTYAMSALIEIDHALISYLLTRDDMDFSNRTYTRKESFQKFFNTSIGVWAERGATALFYATTKKETYKYIPALLDKMKCRTNDFVECQENQIRYKSALTNLVEALPECNDIERGILLPCIMRIANAPTSDLFKRQNKFSPTDMALLTATKNGDEEVVTILLEAGANTCATGNDGRDAASIALFCGHYRISDLIRNHASAVSNRRLG